MIKINLSNCEKEALDSPAISRLISEMKNWNTYPIYINAGGKGTSLGKAMSDAVLEHTERLKRTSKTELIDILSNLTDAFYHGNIDRNAVIEKKLDALKELAIVDLRHIIHRVFFDLSDAIKNDKNQSKTLKKFPELRKKIDEDGLLVLDGTVKADMYCMVYKGCTIYYSQFLRRNFTSNINYDFIDALLKCMAQNLENKASIAIDHSRILKEELFSKIMEFDRWFGPPFEWGKLDSPIKEKQLTVHETPANIPIPFLPYKRTEFLWTMDNNNLKSLQIEELLHPDSKPKSGYFISRYIHTIRDIKHKQFIHLDGAVRFYRQEDYSKRLKQKIYEANPEKYIKLFRVDGNIPNNNWVELLCYFFRENYHLIDYLNPEYHLVEPTYQEFKDILQKMELS